MTNNVAMINEVEERINYDPNGNIVKFPVNFKKSRQMFEKLDTILISIEELKREAKQLEAEANDEMFREYLDTEQYRIAHEFLSAEYKNAQIGNHVLDCLRYGNSKAIQDHEGRWFRTIKDACVYHGISQVNYSNRRKAGWSIKDIFETPTRSYKSKGIVVANIDTNREN